MVRVHPDPPPDNDPRDYDFCQGFNPGAIAQLGERLLCKQEVTGSIPVGSTRSPRNSAPSATRRSWQCVLFGCSLKIRKK